MLLAVNIANKNISFAIFTDVAAQPSVRFDIDSDMRKTADEYAVTVSGLLNFSGIDTTKISAAIISSVVPCLSEVIKQVVLNLTGKMPITVGPGVKTGFAIKIDDPAELGADIVANAAAVVAILKEQKEERPAIILDMGAATTLFAINKKREVVGGAILAGVGMSLDMLHEKTALLPNVELSGVTRAIGRNTKESLISGAILGQAAMIDGLIERFERELRCGAGEAKVFATGANCKPVISNCTHEIIYDPALTLKGLARIYKNTIG
ncbi:MAG: type III pantothenate kinase [Clostridia bacterium]|nr:type III pantothenate kinase [Clostridia bacterium]